MCEYDKYRRIYLLVIIKSYAESSSQWYSSEPQAIHIFTVIFLVLQNPLKLFVSLLASFCHISQALGFDHNIFIISPIFHSGKGIGVLPVIHPAHA